MPRRPLILTTLTFLPLLLCDLFWLRSLSTNLYADLTPGTLHFHLAFKDSTTELYLSHGTGGFTSPTPTYWYHDAEGWRLIFYCLHLNEYQGPRSPHSTFAWKTLGFYTTANSTPTAWSASLHLPFWFLTFAAAAPPIRRLHRLRRPISTRAFPIQPHPCPPTP